jgi:hypothetical protein
MPKRKVKPRLPRNHLVFDVRLRHIEPPIWRRVSVPEDYTLDQLHRIFQLLFGWLDYHLYEFRIADRRFEAPDEEAEEEDSTATYLYALNLEAGSRFEYLYDFGDYWVHDVALEKVVPIGPEPEDPYPAVLAGERMPHEDSGGPHRYMEMRDALSKKSHPDHRLTREWLGPQYDPDRFDSWLANQNLILAAAWGAL